MSEEKYLVALSSYVPFGPVRLELLIDYFGSSEIVWNTSRGELKGVGLSERMVDGFFKHKKFFSFERYFKKLKEKKINYIIKSSDEYPQNLKTIPNPPYVLYVKGKILKKDQNAVSIVGTRKMTSYGESVAKLFTSSLVSKGLTIVSGLARGIDTVSHKEALLRKGRTIAVMACGLDIVYPPENKNLAEEVSESGALVSEYPLGYPSLPVNFAVRNRIISGLSKAVLVVEGRRKSGTLLTVSHAAEQGRTVFAVPGPITSAMSEGPHFLIQNGSRIAISPQDILDELGLEN